MIHIVFDLDGTLSDTQTIHQRIEADFLLTKGIHIDPEIIGKRFSGRTPLEWMTELFEQEGITLNHQELLEFAHQKDKTVVKALKDGQIRLMPQVQETILFLQSRACKMGISSGACREFIDEFIEHFWLSSSLTASTSADEVINKKPHPDVFLSTFKKLQEQYGISDKKYVVGDGWSDVQGGSAAWATTVWLNYFDVPKKDPSLCHFEIHSINELVGIIDEIY